MSDDLLARLEQMAVDWRRMADAGAMSQPAREMLRKCRDELAAVLRERVAQPAYSGALPVVEGYALIQSLDGFERRCLIQIAYEQEKAYPDADVIAVLADAVRCVREYQTLRDLRRRERVAPVEADGGLRAQLEQFVSREEALIAAKGTSGQTVGRNPCIVPSVAKELRRMLRDTEETTARARVAPVEADRQLCRQCNGNGVVKIPGGVSECPHCKGFCWEERS